MTGVEYMCSPFARCGVNVQTTARSMLLRYNIVTERETADALLRADAYLALQPIQAENEKGQLRDTHADGAAKSLTDQEGVGSSGRIRTDEQPPTSADSDPLDPDPKAT